MLKDRITMTDSGFMVQPESESAKKKLQYGLYTFQDDPDAVPEKLTEAQYWEIAAHHEINIPGKEALVYIEETQDGTVSDTARFYWRRAKRKPELTVRVSRARKYGSQAFMVSISWPDGEDGRDGAFHLRYMCLKNIKTNETYCFLRKRGNTAQPPAPGKSDQYVYIVPDNEDPQMYTVAAEPLLKEKYQITITWDK